MKAISVPEPKKIEIVDIPSPQINTPDDVKVKMLYTGICGSDIHFYHGTLSVAEYPRIIGHEGVGIVTEVGANVTKVKVGDHVIGEPLVSCGHCYSCKKGRPNACYTMKARGCHVDGCFAEEYVYPQDVVHKIGNNRSMQEMVLIEPYSIAAQVCFRGRISEGDWVWIIGAGPIGLTVADAAKNIYNANVIITDLIDSRLETAKKINVDHAINSKGIDIEQTIKDITGPYGPNVVVDAVCMPQTFQQAIKIASPAGRIVDLSFSDKEFSVPLVEITKKELDIVGARHQTHMFPKVIEWFETDKLHQELIITKEVPYTDILEAFELIEQKPDEVTKILLKW